MKMAELPSAPLLGGEIDHATPMAEHVSWRAGGAAAHSYKPRDAADLANFLRSLEPGAPILFVGLGSNLLVRDGGFPGWVVLLHGALTDMRVEQHIDGLYLFVEAGVPSPKVARFAALNHLLGAEFLAGIPGTLGGALAMNAGCYDAETWPLVATVTTIDRAGVMRERTPSEFRVGYRTVEPATPREEWFIAARLRLRGGDSDAARARIKELLQRRAASQPLNLPNAGSVFRNPPGDYAARLIEACGLKGARRGGAEVSRKHANFIVNPHQKASAADIETLIRRVQSEVITRFAVALECEVSIVGEPLEDLQ
jgi:UDP-N-acetylmuramate dehydrogenase